MAEVWKNSGLVKVEGIPGPSGSFEVGCTHLMHQDFQIHLYYPTERDQATKYECTRFTLVISISRHHWRYLMFHYQV